MTKQFSTRILSRTKSITAKEIFKQPPEVKKQFWGEAFWSGGYYISAVGAHGNEEMLKNYVKNQGQSNDSMQPLLF